MCSGWSFLTSKRDFFTIRWVSGGGCGCHFFFFEKWFCFQHQNVYTCIYKYIFIYTFQKDQTYPIQWLWEKESPYTFFWGGGSCWRTCTPSRERTYPLSRLFWRCCFFFPRSILHFHAHCSKGKQHNPPRRIFFDGKNTSQTTWGWLNNEPRFIPLRKSSSFFSTQKSNKSTHQRSVKSL